MTGAPRVSVIIPAYFSSATIGRCLDSLRSQTYGDFEIIVVNSSPEDATRRVVMERAPDAIFEQSPTRLYPHAARNRGIDQARGALIAFIDPDCVAHPEWLERLAAVVENGYQAVGGSIECGEGGWAERGMHLCKFYWACGRQPAGPHWILPTANAAYTRAAIAAIGPFRGGRFCADALFSWRAAAAGFRPWFEPRAAVHHIHSGGLRAFLRERFTRGAEFARARMPFERWTRGRAALYLAALPLVPFHHCLLAARLHGFSGDWHWFWSTLPVQWAGHLAWALGEAGPQWNWITKPFHLGHEGRDA